MGQLAFGIKHGITSFPAVVHYDDERGDECLRYIAAKHTPGPVPSDGKEGAPVFELIKAAYEDYKPDYVIAEGFNKSQTEWLIHTCDNPEYINQENPGEALYAVILAKKNNVRVTSGEPEDKDILKEIEKHGYSKDDMAALYLIRGVAEGFRNKAIKEESEIPTFVNKLGEDFEQLFGKKYNYEHCKEWLTKNYGSMWNVRSFKETERTAGVKEGEPLQRVAHEIGILRNKEILTTILDAKKEHKKILVVYGGSHYYVQHKVLDKYFGQPRFTKPPSKGIDCAIL